MPRGSFYTGPDSESFRLASNDDSGTTDQRKAWKRAIAQEQADTQAQLAQGKTLADLGIRDVHEEGRARFNFFGGEEGAKRAGQEMAQHLANKNVQFGHWTKNADGTYNDYGTEADKAAGVVRGTYDQYGQKISGFAPKGSFGSGTWHQGGGVQASQPNALTPGGPTGSLGPTGTGPTGTTGATGPVTMESVLQKILEGKDGSMSQAVVQQLEGRAKRRSENLREQQGQMLDADAIRRGVFNSRTAGAAKAKANRAIDADLSDQVTSIGLQKAQSDFTERMGALDRIQASLQAQRQYALALQGNELQRQQMLAQIDLANRRIQEERNALSSRMDFDREQAAQAHAWQQEAWQQELPWRTAQFESSLLR